MSIFGRSVSEVLLDIQCYLVFTGFFQLLLLIVAALLSLPVLFLRGRGKYLRMQGRLATFAAMLLLFGCLANSIWMITVFDHYYQSRDVVVDFFPFLPFGQDVLDREWNGRTGFLIGGTTLSQLRLMWLGFALPVWVLTVLVYRWVFHRPHTAD